MPSPFTFLVSTAHQLHASAAQIVLAADGKKGKNGKKDKKDADNAPTDSSASPDPSGSVDPSASPDPSGSVDPSAVPSPSGTSGGSGGTSDAFGSILGFLIANPIIPLAVAAWFGALWGWKKLIFKYNIDGRALPPLGSIVSRASRMILKEDRTYVVNRNEKLAAKMEWLTWRRYWLLSGVLAVIAFLPPISSRLPQDVSTVLAAAAVGLILAGAAHIRAVFRRRHRILMQMFEVANAEMKYPKGAELNPWGWVNISAWKDLYTPDTTVVVFPARYRGDEKRTQEVFEANFNSTVSDQHTWTYQWEGANNRVICSPVPFITSNAPYPFPDMNPWSVFPLGIAAGGKEASYDVSVVPHVLVAGTTGSGKAQANSTAIPTVSGWTTMGEIRVGDQVFDEHGKPCTVTWISEVNEHPDLYELVFSDGTTVLADAEHLWWTETRAVRSSRWNAAKKAVSRKTLLPADKIALLRVAAEASGDDEEVTVPETAAMLGLPPATMWLYREADRIGHVSENDIVTLFHYAEQTVVQKQKVTVFDAQEVWSALASYRPRGMGRAAWHARLSECKEFAQQARPGDEVTSVDLRALFDTKSPADAAAIATRAGASGRVEMRNVELFVPAKTVQRKAPVTVRGYPKRATLLAIAERGEWLVNDQRHRSPIGGVKTTAEILATLRTSSGHANHAIPVAGPLELPIAALPIPPYTLGAWLGDGSSRAGDVCGIDWEVAEHIEADGYRLTWHTVPPETCEHPDFRIWISPLLRRHLRENGLLQRTTEEGSKKHIPSVYLRASVEQRRALLAGLLDTDGTVAPQGTVQFFNTNARLAEQVLELARSLGYRATMYSGWKESQTGARVKCWTVAWTCAESPFRLTRKTEAHRERNQNYCEERNATRFIVDIRPVTPEPARCIAVDSPSRMFLCSEAMIPTHNSVTQRTILLHALQSADWRVVLIDPKRVELSAYAKHPHVLKIATELDESVALVEQVEQEMHARYKSMAASGVNHFKSLPDPPPALLLMVDELFALLSPENVKSDEGKERDELHARAGLLIGSIARLGRAAGVHLVMATQRPDAKILGGETKALALDTPVLTIDGWSTMGDLSAGDTVFDVDGLPCRVIKATNVMTGHPCYRVVFSDGEAIVADAGHEWVTFAPDGMSGCYAQRAHPVTTQQIAESMRRGGALGVHGVPRVAAVRPDGGKPGTAPVRGEDFRFVVACEPVPSVPVRCIAVDSPSRQFLAGRRLVPTHNSNLDVRIAQGRMDTTPSLMVLDSEIATRLPGIKGRAMLRAASEFTEFQAYFLPPEALDQVLEMSAAIAQGVISAEDLLEAVKGSQEGDGKRRLALPRIPVPDSVSRAAAPWRSRLAGWVERRKALVEANEARSEQFGKERGRRRKKEADPADFPPAHRDDPSVMEAVAELDADGPIPEAGQRMDFGGARESGFDEFDEDFLDEFDDLYEEDVDGSLMEETLASLTPPGGQMSGPGVPTPTVPAEGITPASAPVTEEDDPFGLDEDELFDDIPQAETLTRVSPPAPLDAEGGASSSAPPVEMAAPAFDADEKEPNLSDDFLPAFEDHDPAAGADDLHVDDASIDDPFAVPMPDVLPPPAPAPPAPAPPAPAPPVPLDTPVQELPVADAVQDDDGFADLSAAPWMPQVPIPDGPTGPSPFGVAQPAAEPPTPPTEEPPPPSRPARPQRPQRPPS